MATNGMFVGLSRIVASAAVSSVAVFVLFNSLLTELVPPFEDSQQTVGFATFGTAIVLLALSLLIRKSLTVIQAKWIAIVSGILFVVSLFVFFPFRDMTRTYVYRYPPASAPHAEQSRHIRGDLHARGLEIVKTMTVAQAVYQLGGPDQVNAMGTLWLENSRLSVISRMEQYYVALAMLLTSALFAASLAVWRQQQR